MHYDCIEIIYTYYTHFTPCIEIEFTPNNTSPFIADSHIIDTILYEQYLWSHEVRIQICIICNKLCTAIIKIVHVLHQSIIR